VENTVLSKHDELLLRDIQMQPVWLLWLYVAVGLGAAVFAAFILDWRAESLLAAGGGFLVALGAEKLVTRRIRLAALQTLQSSAPENSA
jgi:hypothetical protein